MFRTFAAAALLTTSGALPTSAGAAPAARPPHPGEQVYREVCQACHMANARGAIGAGRIASLANNANLEVAAYPIAVVTGGKGAMPWFRGDLTDQQIADVIGYVRVNFGNNYKSKVTAAMVAADGIAAPAGADR